MSAVGSDVMVLSRFRPKRKVYRVMPAGLPPKRRVIFALILLFIAMHQANAEDLSLRDVPPDLMRRVRTGNLSEEDCSRAVSMSLRLVGAKKQLDARQLLESVCKSKHAKAKDFVHLARTYVDELGDFSASNKVPQLLKKALQMDPNCSEAYVTQANLSLADGASERALQLANRAIACPQRDSTSFIVRAKALAAMKRYKEALAAVEESEKIGYLHAENYRIKGSILENLGRYDDAVTAYRKSYSMHRHDWTTFRIVHCLEVQKKFSSAISELDGLIAANPRDGEAFRIRAQIKVKNKDLKGALKDMDSTIGFEPSIQGYKERAKILELLGKPELARKDLDAARKLSDSPF